MITDFTVCGERNSGTNYIQRLLPEMYKINYTFKYGPKHFMGWHDAGLADSYNTLCICMVRNPYDWLMALFKTKHHVPFHMKTKRSFLLSEWYSIHHGRGHKDYGKERTDDRYWIDGTRHKNIFEMRRRKLQYIKNTIPNLAKNHYLIRYEDLCNNTKQVLKDIGNKFELKEHKIHFEKSVEKAPYKVEPAILQIINENIDWETESLFNYEINRRRY